MAKGGGRLHGLLPLLCLRFWFRGSFQPLETDVYKRQPYLVGIMLFVFDLFGPIKALYTQATRLTVMNSCKIGRAHV